MIESLNDRVIPTLLKNKHLRAFIALLGVLLVAVGFQGYSIAFVPPGMLAGVGIFSEVGLVYITSIEVENARKRITEQREEIEGILGEMREIHSEINRAKSEVNDVRGEVEEARGEISDAQREIEDASDTAQSVESEVEDMKRSIERAADRL